MAHGDYQTSFQQLVSLVEQSPHDSGDILVPRELLEQFIDGAQLMEQQLEASQAQLVQSEKMATLGQLIAGIAHEISTPVASINSNIDLLGRSFDKAQNILESATDGVDAQQRKLMQIVTMLARLNQSNETAASRIVAIIRSLRNFARTNMAEMREDNIHEMLDNALTLVHHELKRRIEVVREYGEIPSCLCFPNRLNGVFVNMLVNAAQAIKDKGTITIRTSRVDDRIQIEFTDTGDGISAENLSRIFERGFTTKPPGEGTGLGLAICQEIVEEHGGRIEVRSEVGQGTTFTLIFPITVQGVTEHTCQLG